MRAILQTTQGIRAIVTDQGEIIGLPKNLHQLIRQQHRNLLDVAKPGGIDIEVASPPDSLPDDCLLFKSVSVLTNGFRLEATNGTTVELSTAQAAVVFS